MRESRAMKNFVKNVVKGVFLRGGAVLLWAAVGSRGMPLPAVGSRGMPLPAEAGEFQAGEALSASGKLHKIALPPATLATLASSVGIRNDVMADQGQVQAYYYSDDRQPIPGEGYSGEQPESAPKFTPARLQKEVSMRKAAVNWAKFAGMWQTDGAEYVQWCGAWPGGGKDEREKALAVFVSKACRALRPAGTRADFYTVALPLAKKDPLPSVSGGARGAENQAGADGARATAPAGSGRPPQPRPAYDIFYGSDITDITKKMRISEDELVKYFKPEPTTYRSRVDPLGVVPRAGASRRGLLGGWRSRSTTRLGGGAC